MKIAHKIAVAALLWLIFVNPGTITSIDTIRRLSMSHAWWTRTEESFPGNKIVININNKNYIPYDLGQSILMLPGDWLGEQLGKGLQNKLVREHFREAIVCFLIFTPINLLAVLACFRFLRLLDYSEKVAGLSSLIWLIGTSMLFYSSFHQQNNQVLLFVLFSYQAALIYLMKTKKIWAVLSGAALGFAFIIRITNVLYVASLLTFLIGCIISKAKTKSISEAVPSVLWWMSGFIPFVLLERVLNFIRYGSWTATTVALHLQIYDKTGTIIDPDAVVAEVNRGFPFLKLLTKVKPEALFAPFISPEKSIFLYDPLILPCLILLFVCWKYLSQYIKWYAIATIVGFLLHVYIYSWTPGWINQGAWGARYHVTSIHLLLIPLIPLLIQGAIKQISQGKNLRSKVLTWGSRAVIVLAICIQVSSITIDGAVEAYQQQLGIGSSLRIGQRFKNISTLLINGTVESKVNVIQVEDVAKATAIKEQIANRTGWNILPFLYQKKSEKSPLNKVIPILIVLWGLILVAAVGSTIWIFIS